MKIGELSSVNTINSYQEQGSSVKAPSSSEASTKEFVTSEAAQAAHSVVKKNNDNSEQISEKDAQGASSSLKEAVNKINSTGNSCEAVFSMHEDTNRVMIKMVDKNTKKVIKEFPAEETLDLIAKAWELAGIMVDEKR